MPNDCITYQNSGYFTKLMIDYLDEKSVLKPLYNHFPTIENFKKQIEEKSLNFNDNGNFKRQVLVSELERQNIRMSLSKYSVNNINLLKDSNTFTITTGHQLNLFLSQLLIFANN